MNKEMVSRLREAGKYEKMAIRALLPERAVKHMEVIEKEMRTMFMEMVTDAVRCAGNVRNDDGQNESEKEKDSKVKKINIG
ncbi:hypothetical protein [Anaerocolumna xylanovorans]|uniref:Uncharacterized protein n=1 Tax=Anaerocolumna xylanovorans DSM 12503 TaxID=1121345 RepID=A0A1M7XWI9_9FIRM|nr:hypothetical protein [Anaerocolumna xylanovorans]SHO42951.1 hypothetical protein SAMN02745217_00035 [Anaerocolumna xylanovorans DSM 12503]